MDTVICGIDPGLRVTGYAVIRAAGGVTSVVDAGVCRVEESPPLSQRLLALHRDVSAVLAEHKPEFVAVEELYAHYKHPRTAILMGHARGVILHAAASAGIEVRHFAATHIKRFLTGNGHASKGQVQRAVQVALALDNPPEPNDVADALAIALACAAEVSRKTTPEVCA